MTELLVVIAVVGIIMAVSVPTLWTYFRTAALRGAAEELVTVLNGARQLAIRTNATVCVTNDGTPTGHLERRLDDSSGVFGKRPAHALAGLRLSPSFGNVE